jgi:RNA-directed DNA polymerase
MQEWLAKIGLERYAAVFIDNDIDVDVLCYLTDADLEKIGVSLGHRRKLLAAIAELCGGAATPARPPTEPNKQEAAERRETARAAVAPPPPSASAEAAGERRYLTVMFCDLVGSTGIAAKLDAEEWRDLVGAYLDAASAAVMEMGGHVAKKLGDGLLALFGYPLAHENDAERAIPKPDGGGVRKLGIPTVLDRFVQQAVMQVLQRQWNPTFSQYSYGFRPRRSAHHAVAQAQQYIAQGNGWVIDLDLEKFFDRVNHDKLMGQIAKRIEDRRLLKLIRAFLNAGVMENGLVSPSVEGTPQGGPLSPLLSNLVLDELDRELEHRGHRFVRYADDCNIYVRSERAGQRVMESISRFITQKLKLKVNEAKSAVARPQERKFLGFSFTAGPDIKRTIAPKSLERFKQRIRETTRRAKGVSIKTTMEELAKYMRGWRGYFGFCETPEVLIALTRWVRLRLRAALWRQWKTPRRRRAALIALGVSGELRNMAGSGRGPWHIARSKALSVGLSNAHFKSLGLLSLVEAR